MTPAGLSSITVVDGSYMTTTMPNTVAGVRYEHPGQAFADQYGGRHRRDMSAVQGPTDTNGRADQVCVDLPLAVFDGGTWHKVPKDIRRERCLQS